MLGAPPARKVVLAASRPAGAVHTLICRINALFTCTGMHPGGAGLLLWLVLSASALAGSLAQPPAYDPALWNVHKNYSSSSIPENVFLQVGVGVSCGIWGQAKARDWAPSGQNV